MSIKRVRRWPRHQAGMTEQVWADSMHRALTEESLERLRDFDEFKREFPFADANDYPSFEIAVANIGSTEKTLVISKSMAVSTNTTIPANVQLMFVGDGELAVANGVTVTINGDLIAPPHKIFALTGTGTVAISDAIILYVRPEWWTTNTTPGTTDMTTALTAAWTAHPVVHLAATTYKITGALTVPINTTLAGSGPRATNLLYSGSDAVVMRITDTSVNPANCRLSGFRLYQVVDTATDRVGLQVDSNYNLISDIVLRGFKYNLKVYGTDSRGTAYNEFIKIDSTNTLYGVWILADTGGYANENHFWGGQYSGVNDASSWSVRIEYYATHTPDQNKFYGCNLEGASNGIYCDGDFNEFYGPRLENSGTYDIYFDTNATYNYVMSGLGSVNITDNSTSKRNYHFINGKFYATTFGYTSQIVTTTHPMTGVVGLIICNSASNFTVTLPAATGSGYVYKIKNINTGVVTLEGDGAETIDGAANQTLNQWDVLTVCDYGSGTWVIV